MSPEQTPPDEQTGPDEQTTRDEQRAAWEAVLTSLEQAAVADDPAPWHEPTGLGPVPRDLVGRASRLLAAQRDRMQVLERDRRSTLEHLGALRAVDATREPQRSVYLDASA